MRTHAQVMSSCSNRLRSYGVCRASSQWGVVSRDFDTELDAKAVGNIDLLSALNGGRALGCSNKHYGHPRNLV